MGERKEREQRGEKDRKNTPKRRLWKTSGHNGLYREGHARKKKNHYQSPGQALIYKKRTR